MSEKQSKKQRERQEFGQVSMVIQCTRSIPSVDRQGAFELDEHNEMRYTADQEGWTPLIERDIPVWVTSADIIAVMAEGTEVNWSPGGGGRWYRGIICALETDGPSKAVH